MKKLYRIIPAVFIVVLLASTFLLPSAIAAEIFSNGFEEGDFSAWTGTGGAPAVVSSWVHCGSYACECGPNENVYYDFTPMSEAYARFYFNFTTAPGASGQLEVADLFVISRDNGIRVLVYNDGGTLKWRISVLNSGLGTTVDTADSPNPAVNTVYCVELYWKAGTAGGAKLYVDDALVLTTSATTRAQNVDRLKLKNYNVGANYFDCVVLADAYVGPEEEEEVYVVDLTVASPENTTYFAEEIAVSLSTSGNETGLVTTWNVQFSNSSWLYESNQTYVAATSFSVSENYTATFCAYTIGDNSASDYEAVGFTVWLVEGAGGGDGEDYMVLGVVFGCVLGGCVAALLLFKRRG